MSGKRVLVCPMDWGLGHASRDVEIIDHLLKNGFDVLIGADKAPLLFLKQHFPNVGHLIISSHTINYAKRGTMVLKMLAAVPKILWGIYKEHQLLKKIIKTNKIDIIISDNRYGLWNKKAYSIFISHQVWIKNTKTLRFTEPVINYVNHWFINKYDECWIPDMVGNQNLSGGLSHQRDLPKNASYIGILSRFKLPLEKPENIQMTKMQFDILVILSGPEPQRSILEKKLTNQILATHFKTLIVQGRLREITQSNIENIRFINHLDSFNLKNLILNTPIIICRSGYSSIMDLITLKKNAILIPTPGQTEQEYLAKYLKDKKCFFSVSQREFELEKSIAELDKFKINCKFEEKELLHKQVLKLNEIFKL